MTNQDALTYTLIETLAKIKFSQQYYDYYENRRGKKTLNKYSEEDLRSVVSLTNLDFQYNKREKFFAYLENIDSLQLGLHIAFPAPGVEFILVIKTESGFIGGPFPMLARKSAQLHDPNFTYSPASPKIPFSTTEELRATLAFGIDLFQQIKRALLHQGLADH